MGSGKNTFIGCRLCAGTINAVTLLRDARLATKVIVDVDDVASGAQAVPKTLVLENDAKTVTVEYHNVSTNTVEIEQAFTHVVESDLTSLNRVTTVARSDGSRAVNDIKNLINADRALLVEPQAGTVLAQQTDDYMAALRSGNTALQGQKGEEIAETLAREMNPNGQVVNMHSNGSNNGFDIISIGRDVNGNVTNIRIFESKPISAGSTGIELSSTNSGAQMSTDWINQTIQDMIDHPSDQAIRDMGNLIDQNRTLIERYVTTISKDLKQPTIMKLDIFQH